MNAASSDTQPAAPTTTGRGRCHCTCPCATHNQLATPPTPMVRMLPHQLPPLLAQQGAEMSELTDLPEWVWNLLDALDAYEDEHPALYRFNGGNQYEQEPCFGKFLTDRAANPPPEAQEMAAFRRKILRDAKEPE